jgi:RNA polymerase sigma-70 factor (ECF subfamily)
MPSVLTSRDRARERAIAAMVVECGPMLRAVVRRIVRNDSDTDDVVQDAFVSAYRHWGEFRGDSKPCTWLHAIAVRAAIRRARREARRRDVAREFARALPFHQPRLADADFARHSREARELRDEARARVDEAIETLPEPFRSAIVVKEIGGLSIADAARVLGVKEATVKTRVHRGRLLLRARLLAERPRRAVPPPVYSPRICMDLLRAKMDALDRGVPFPIQDELVCDRCRQVLASLDVGADACRALRTATMPAALRRRIRAALAASGEGTAN